MIKCRFLSMVILLGINLLLLSGCHAVTPMQGQPQNADREENGSSHNNSEPEKTQADERESNATAQKTESGTADSDTEETDTKDSENRDHYYEEEEDISAVQLTETGSCLMDFVPEGWEVFDSVELDFNKDGIPDYVGVLEVPPVDMGDYMMYQGKPRILFAIASDGTNQYHLDFQDSNLIRTRGEGGVFGDPYLPLTGEGDSFTIHAYGGSAWRWSEDFTYTYQNGIWYQTLSQSTYGYGDYITSYKRDDYESGIGIRRKRSDEFSQMEKHWRENEDPSGTGGYSGAGAEVGDENYDVEYELHLDEPLTLYQSSMRWWLAPDRITDWTVDGVEFAAGVILSADKVKYPDQVYLGGYCDEECVIYEFMDEDSGLYYLVRYGWEDRIVSVLAQETTAIDGIEAYKGKIYYTTEIKEEIAYRMMRDGQEELVREEDVVGIRLNRMNLDGTGKESVFDYRYPGGEQEIMEKQPPYLAMSYEVSGDEIVAEVYVGNEPHPVYRVHTDGSGLYLVGQIPKEMG